MPQSKIRSLQINSSDFQQIVAHALGVSSISVTPSAGQALTYATSTGSPPLSLVSSAVGGGGGGGGSPFEFVLFTNVATQSITAAGAVSLNLNDTSQAADEDVWRVGVTGSDFIIATRTDADGAGVSAISITRTGTAVDDITIPSPLILTSSGTASTSTAAQISANNPAFAINKTNATANQGVWDITGETDGQLIHRTRTDAFGTGATWLTVNRSGTTVGEIALAGTSLTFNGVPVVVGGSPYTGGGGGGDFVEAGSPETTINAKPLFLSDTFRIYDPSQSSNIDISVDGASSTYFDLSSFGAIYFRSSGTTQEYAFGTTALTLNDGKNIRIFASGDSYEIDFINDGTDLVFSNNSTPGNNIKLEDMGLTVVGSGSPNNPITTISNTGTITLNKVWTKAGDGPLLLRSVGPILEFQDDTTGDSGIIELSNSFFRFGKLAQGSPVGPGYDGLLTVGHSAFSPNYSLFDFTGYQAEFTLTGGQLNVIGTTNISGDININSKKAISEEGFLLTLNHGSPQPFANGVWIPGETLFGGNITVDTNGIGPGILIGDGDMADGDVLLELNSDARFQFLQDGNTGTAQLALRTPTNDNFVIQNSAGTDQFTFDIVNGDFTASNIAIGGSPALITTQAINTDGVLSGIRVQDAEGLQVDVGFNQMLWKQKNATMATTDNDWRGHAGHVTYSDNATTYTWTTPASTDNVVPDGATYTLANLGSGNITIAAGAGVTLTWLDGSTGGTGSRTLQQYGVATLSKRSTTAWYIWGTGII